MSPNTVEIAPVIRQQIAQCLELFAEEDLSAALRAVGTISEELADQSLVMYLVGLLSIRVGEPGKALEALGNAHAIAPGLFEPAEALSIVHANLGHVVDAAYFQKLAASATSQIGIPGILPAWLGNFRKAFLNMREQPLLKEAQRLAAVGLDAEALKMFQKEVEVESGSAAGWRGLAVTLQRLNRPHQAVVASEALISLQPDHGPDLALHAEMLAASGHFEAALEFHDRAEAAAPEDAGVGFARIRTLASWPACPPAQVDAAMIAWGQRFAATITPPPVEERRPLQGRKLRIGVVASHWANGEGLDLIVPVIEQLDRRIVEIFCYVEGMTQMPLARRLRGRANSWQELDELDDETASYVVANDALDVLLDLDGPARSTHNLLFLSRPAGFALSLYGFPGGAAALGFDGALTSAAGPGAVDVPGGFVTFPADMLRRPRALRPGASADSATFGSLVRLSRISSATIDAWADLLRLLPQARLLLDRRLIGADPALDEFTTLIGGRVPLDRISIMSEDEPAETYLDAIDVLLDPLDNPEPDAAIAAISHSIPVVTCRSTRSRAALLPDWLVAVGLDDLVAADPAAYGATAAALADPARRAAVQDKIFAIPSTAPSVDAGHRAVALLTALLKALPRP